MRPTTAYDNVFDLNALLHRRKIFDHQRDVVADPYLSIAEKRAMLASWASDASAVKSSPSLRWPRRLKAPVTVDKILESLRELDFSTRDPPGGKPFRVRSADRAIAA
jgi:hypothetical protein